MVIPEFRQDLFISYVEEDSGTVVDLVRELESADIKTWYYERDNLPGLPYFVQVMKNIDAAPVVMIIISPESLNSRQVYNEITYAHEKGKSFLPVLKNISHAEFQKNKPEWRMILGAFTSIQIPEAGISPILPRIINGTRNLLQNSLNDTVEKPMEISPDLPRKPTVASEMNERKNTHHVFSSIFPGIINKTRKIFQNPVDNAGENNGQQFSDLSQSPAVTGGKTDSKTKDLIFICAKQEDNEYADQVFIFLSGKGFPVFFCPWTVLHDGNSEYPKEIVRALDEAKHLIIVTSKKEYVDSTWVQAEWGYFINEKRAGRRTGNIVNVLAGSMRFEDLPICIRNFETISLSDPNALEQIFNYLNK